MTRKRPERKNQKLLDLIREAYEPQSAEDVKEALKDLISGLLEEMLKAELDEHLDYEYGGKLLSISTRNDYSSKTVKLNNG